ncbi:uridine 5'-monophosphate synthase-like isoform X2 [Planococcus citri]|uniref:uridine 5'-monophosphate synthase-like isoform X2 n=1 Tax=Planococcus citri TaxID=170843 RepID=UPI0031F9ABA0
MTDELKELAVELFNAGVVKFGKFHSTSGCILDSWFDLLVVFAHPSLMDKMGEYAYKFFTEKKFNFHSICGVSYAGLPFSVIIASKLCKPFLIWNKEPSLHSAERRISGKTPKNEYCIVIEEVTCSGRSILEVIRDIEASGMRVKDVFTLFDLEQGAIENLGEMGYEIHSIMKMSQFAEILFDEGLITADRRDIIIKGFSDKFALNGDCITNSNLEKRKLVQYDQRVHSCKSEIGRKLLKLMSEKKSNLCVEITDQNIDTVVQVAELIGPYISILSINWYVFENSEEFKLKKLLNIAKNHNFFLMDDSKLSEDGDVLIEQCRRRFKFVDLLTIYAVPGKNMLLSIKSVMDEFPQKGIFVVACPNVTNALVGSNFEKNSIDMTVATFEEVTGFISNKNSEIPLGYICMRSDLKNSVSIGNSSDNSFYSNEMVVSNIGADIVQLHFRDFENIDELVKKEQSLLWNAYLKRFGSMELECNRQ